MLMLLRFYCSFSRVVVLVVVALLCVSFDLCPVVMWSLLTVTMFFVLLKGLNLDLGGLHEHDEHRSIAH